MDTCRHCSKSKVSRPRGLCWGCYYTPGVKELYPIPSDKLTRRGLGIHYGDLPCPPAATDTLPGTPERVAVLEERMRLGYAIRHPEDRR
jgi:hypothetical protein